MVTLASAGAVVSRTVMVNEPVDSLPAASRAFTVTVVVPIGNVVPDGWEYVIVGTAVTASVAVAEKFATAPAADVASSVRLAGTVSAGAIVSFTITVNDAEPTSPAASFAVTVTIVLPSGNVLPLGGF